jgi:hypothetical protein
MAICLISAISFISAEDFDDNLYSDASDDSDVSTSDDDVDVSDSGDDNNANEKVNLTVKVDWKDTSKSNRPNSITVYIKNGKGTVETVVLSSDDDWTKTVELDKNDAAGKEISYSVSSDQVSGYKDPVVTNQGNVFSITNELKESTTSDSNKNADNKLSSNDKEKNNTIVNNKTIINNTKIVNNTKNINKTTIVNNTTNLNNTNTTVLVKNHFKENPKNDSKNKTQQKLKNTGNPILILVVVIIIVAVAYYFYRKR